MLVLLFVALCFFFFFSTRRFVLCLTLCHFVLVFFSPFSIACGRESYLSAFRTFVRFVLVWICRFPLPLEVWEGLRFVIVPHPGLFSYLFFTHLGMSRCHSVFWGFCCFLGFFFLGFFLVFFFFSFFFFFFFFFFSYSSSSGFLFIPH